MRAGKALAGAAGMATVQEVWWCIPSKSLSDMASVGQPFGISKPGCNYGLVIADWEHVWSHSHSVRLAPTQTTLPVMVLGECIE